MRTEFELVVLQPNESTSTDVMRELASLGRGFTLVQLNEPAMGHAAIDLVFTALARNEAAQRTSAEWVVYLDATIALHGQWLIELQRDLHDADALDSPISVADDRSVWDAGRRADVAYRRAFLDDNGGFPVGPDFAGQEDLLLGLRCLTEGRPLMRGRRRSEQVPRSA